ncbi:MAG: sigma 54-interacting transcriptional regulator [Desulfobacter sp.]|nr:MAG: sigma 54-interacting transcriptional regulator [Desulfobacter sp.]
MPPHKKSLKCTSAFSDVEIYQRIFDSIQNGIMVTDPKGYITYLNPAYGRFLNLDPEMQTGRHCTEVVENTRMHIVGKTGKAEINHIQGIKGLNIVVQRIPVKKKGKVIAVFGLVMFSDLKEITRLAQKVGMLESKVKLYEAELLSLRTTRYSFESIIGESPVMRDLKDEALRATASSYPVLILGDCGTGKEMFAQAIHHSSARRVHPFVKINCAAIPRDLLESELFGYDKGAFTGARTKGKPGKFELAHRGTIFLDEIGDMPVEMQPKLLRVIEEKEFERVGGTRVIRSDFRLIAATNRNLEKMMDEGSFRRDLYYRLNVIPLNIPQLKHRREDIGLLAQKLLKQMASEADLYDVRLDDQALKGLMDYHWPGNVRELANVLERTLSRLDNNVIRMDDLPFYIQQKRFKKIPADKGSLRAIQMDTEKSVLEQVLKDFDYNKTRAAEHLGIHRTLLYRKLKKHGIALHP